MARRGDARGEGRRPRAPQPLRGPRRRRGASRRPSPGGSIDAREALSLFSGAYRPLFVTIEGVDFAGKSTLVGLLKETFAGVPYCFTREPGGTPAADALRTLLLDPKVEIDPLTEAYLYAAARADHVQRTIRPSLEARQCVVCDRFLDSNLAYQGYGRGLGAETVRKMNEWAVGDLVPDLTFYLRVPAGERERRAQASGAALDRIESQGGEFARRVEEGFEELALSEPGRIKVLDGLLPPEEIAQEAGRRILELPEIDALVRRHLGREPR